MLEIPKEEPKAKVATNEAYINSIIRRSRDPPFPIKAIAVAGGTSPWLASSSVSGKSRARAPRPNDVAKENGTANQTSPPNK